MPVIGPSNLRWTSKSKTAVTLAWDQSGDDPGSYQIYKDGVTDGLAIPGEFRSFTVSGLTANTEYSFKVCADNSTFACSNQIYVTTDSIALNPVTNLQTISVTTTKTKTTWTKPTPAAGTTFSKYIVYLVGRGVNEQVYISDINTQQYEFDYWKYGCQTVNINVTVVYSQGSSDKKYSSYALGPRTPLMPSPLIVPFSELDVKAAMQSVNEPNPLTKLTDVNEHNGYIYTGLDRNLLPGFFNKAIEKLSDLEGYPRNEPIVMPGIINIDDGVQSLSNKFTVTSFKRWKLKTTDISPGIFQQPGLSDPEPPESTTSTSAISDPKTYISANSSTSPRTGKLELYYETIECSGNFDKKMKVFNLDGSENTNGYITILQAGTAPPPDPGPDVPSAGSIDALKFVGNPYYVTPVPFPLMSLGAGQISSLNATGEYAGTSYTGNITTTTVNYNTTNVDTLLQKQRSLVQTGKLAVDITNGYSNLYENGIRWQTISSPVRPAIFLGWEFLESSKSADKMWYYDENILKGIIDDNRLHFLTDELPSGVATSIYVPVYVNPLNELAKFEAIYKNTATIKTMSVKYLQLNLSAEHQGKSGISYKQRKVLSYGNTVYLNSFTQDLRSDTTVVSSWKINLYIGGSVRMFFPGYLYTRWD